MEIGVSLERALEIANQLKIDSYSETVPLSEASGRVLSSDIASKVHDPRFDNSAMDGWAVREADCQEMGTALRIVGTSQAGSEELPKVGPGEACSIMTGAPIPEGADAIVIVEDSMVEDSMVTINGPARPGYIRKRGENLLEGSVVLKSGTLLNPSSVSLAATMGHAEIPTVVPFRIAVIGVGDELYPPGQDLPKAGIYESNTFGIEALVRKMGGSPQRQDLIPDSIEKLRDALDDAANSCDAIITSGGVSMGKWDIVREIMEKEGDIRFWRVLMRPGGPPLFGTWRGKPIFGLPGNPVSAHVVFTVLVAPWLVNSMGSEDESGPRLANRVRVVMQDSLRGAPGKICLRRISIRQDGDVLVGTTNTHQGSGNIHSMVSHNGLSLLPPGEDCDKGDTIDALWLC